MDTRQKILTLEGALSKVAILRAESVRFVAASGTFDVLTADMATQLEQRSRRADKLFVLLINPENPLMPLHVRAELAAALRVVDFVVPVEGSVSDLVAQLQPAEWVRLEQQHQDSITRLIQHVIERHDR